LFVKITPC